MNNSSIIIKKIAVEERKKYIAIYLFPIYPLRVFKTNKKIEKNKKSYKREYTNKLYFVGQLFRNNHCNPGTKRNLEMSRRFTDSRLIPRMKRECVASAAASSIVYTLQSK